MRDPHDLLEHELYAGGKRKGDRPYTPTALRIFGLARVAHDTREGYAPLPDEMLGVGATRGGLLLAQILFGAMALVMLSLIYPLRQLGYVLVRAVASLLGESPTAVQTLGVYAQWIITILGVFGWIASMPELYSRFVEAPTIRTVALRFATLTGGGAAIWLLAALFA
jgi:hypothetical protein